MVELVKTAMESRFDRRPSPLSHLRLACPFGAVLFSPAALCPPGDVSSRIRTPCSVVMTEGGGVLPPSDAQDSPQQSEPAWNVHSRG